MGCCSCDVMDNCFRLRLKRVGGAGTDENGIEQVQGIAKGYAYEVLKVWQLVSPGYYSYTCQKHTHAEETTRKRIKKIYNS